MQRLTPLTVPEQAEILEAARWVVSQHPLFVPVMPAAFGGCPFSYHMTNCGTYGWLSSCERGFHYTLVSPFTQKFWPRMPDVIRDLSIRAATEAGFELDPQSCLINRYLPRQRLGLHRDVTEKIFTAPVVSFSIGATGIFLLGGMARGDATEDVVLASGDVVVLGGPWRKRFHGFKGLLPGTAPAALGLTQECRINLTIRQVE